MAKRNEESASCCVLTLPLLTEPWQEHILEKRFKIIEHLQNSLIGFELRKYNRLKQTKEYRALQKELDEIPKEKRKALYLQRRDMLKKAGFDEYTFKNDITSMQKHFVEHIATQIAHKAASDVWRAFDKFLFGNGNAVHRKKRGSLESVSNQQAGVSMQYKSDCFTWSGGRCKNKIDVSIRVARPKTEYEKEMLTKQQKKLRVVRKWMKTRYKYYLQITLAGEPVRKNREIVPGRVGIDIGTQTIAIASEKGVRLMELVEQINGNHRELHQIQRKMDTSRRAMNPDNYNPDGTIRRGQRGVRLKWTYSNRYKRLAGRARELQRKNADIRKYQHCCLANYILSLGDEIYVEPMQFAGLQRRAKETTTDEKGRFRKKKRFGKSLANKAPSMLINVILKNKAKAMGVAGVKEVDRNTYKASQYDHTDQTFRKKLLSERLSKLSNGDTVQRDMYSAFLLMNADEMLRAPDQNRCEEGYARFKELHDREFDRIRRDGKRHLSSFGIAV